MSYMVSVQTLNGEIIKQKQQQKKTPNNSNLNETNIQNNPTMYYYNVYIPYDLANQDYQNNTSHTV